jgi:hypothetical protein
MTDVGQIDSGGLRARSMIRTQVAHPTLERLAIALAADTLTKGYKAGY